MEDHSENTTEVRKQNSRLLKIFTFIGISVAILLIIDTVLYFQIQNRITHVVETLQTEAKSKGQTIHFDISKRGGWPFGAWAIMDRPKFSKVEGPISTSFLGTAFRIGGSWIDWINGYTKYNGVPFTLIGKSVSVIASGPRSTTILTENAHLYLHKSKNEFKVHFDVKKLHTETSEHGSLINTATFHDFKGIMQADKRADSLFHVRSQETTINHAEITFPSPKGTVPLSIGQIHMAFNLNTTPGGEVFTLQDFSVQLPSLALSAEQKGNKQNATHIPAIVLSGKGVVDKKILEDAKAANNPQTRNDKKAKEVLKDIQSLELTLRIDAWRDLIRSSYHQYGKTIIGEKVSPNSEALLSKFLGSDGPDADKPLVMSVSIKNGELEKYDLGDLRLILQTFRQLRGLKGAIH